MSKEYEEMLRRHQRLRAFMDVAWALTIGFVVYCLGRGILW